MLQLASPWRLCSNSGGAAEIGESACKKITSPVGNGKHDLIKRSGEMGPNCITHGPTHFAYFPHTEIPSIPSAFQLVLKLDELKAAMPAVVKLYPSVVP